MTDGAIRIRRVVPNLWVWALRTRSVFVFYALPYSCNNSWSFTLRICSSFLALLLLASSACVLSFVSSSSFQPSMLSREPFCLVHCWASEESNHYWGCSAQRSCNAVIMDPVYERIFKTQSFTSYRPVQQTLPISHVTPSAPALRQVRRSRLVFHWLLYILSLL